MSRINLSNQIRWYYREIETGFFPISDKIEHIYETKYVQALDSNNIKIQLP